MQDITKKIIATIKNNFPNGIRDDFIDTNRAWRIYSAECPDENISRDRIVETVRANGIESGGRFYFLSDDEAERILLAFDAIFEKYSIVYYSALYEKHADFFARLNIFSPDVLKEFLRTTDTTHFYFDEFCASNRMARLDREVSKIFMAAEKSLSLEDLQAQLPYVPKEKISAVLSDTQKYLPTVADKFIPLSQIQFDCDEIIVAKQQISAQIDANGYAAPEDCELSTNFALNPELSEAALRNVIYKKFFSPDFTRRGKNLFGKGDVSEKKQRGDLTQRLRNFTAAQDELPVKNLLAFAKNSGAPPSVALQVAHEMMVRVSEELFVNGASVNFDVDGVDEALRPFVPGIIIPLRAVTSFTGFPPVEGYTWNLFLLESFLRKYSREYTFDAPAANNAQVGAIYPKSMKFSDYREVQVKAVIQENVTLEKAAVEDFLVGQGYRKNRIDKVTTDVIIRAQEILNQ